MYVVFKSLVAQLVLIGIFFLGNLGFKFPFLRADHGCIPQWSLIQIPLGSPFQSKVLQLLRLGLLNG
jgi:hypothetical protein